MKFVDCVQKGLLVVKVRPSISWVDNWKGWTDWEKQWETSQRSQHNTCEYHQEVHDLLRDLCLIWWWSDGQKYMLV